MKATMLYGPGDVRFEERPDPTILQPTDAIIRVSVACVCGSDLWPYRGAQPINGPTPMGHEYCGIVEEVGRDGPHDQARASSSWARSRRPTTPVRTASHGYQSSCVQREFMSEAQAPLLRVPLADGTLVATNEVPSDDLLPSLLTTSDVLGTGWFAADAANVKPGATVAVVGDGAVGSAWRPLREADGRRTHHRDEPPSSRQALAREFGATDIVTERGDEGVARIKELTKGVGADSVLECVGTQESMLQAIRATRPGGGVGFVGVPHGVGPRWRAALLLSRAPARRSGAGAPLPATPHRPRPEGPASILARSSISRCPSTRWRRAIVRWTSDAPSRRCCARSGRHGARDVQASCWSRHRDRRAVDVGVVREGRGEDGHAAEWS